MLIQNFENFKNKHYESEVYKKGYMQDLQHFVQSYQGKDADLRVQELKAKSNKDVSPLTFANT